MCGKLHEEFVSVIMHSEIVKMASSGHKTHTKETFEVQYVLSRMSVQQS